MENKRSKGVTFWAWVFIVISTSFVVGGIIDVQHYGIRSLIWTTFGMAYGICGFLLLKLKEPARKTIIILSVVSFILFQVMESLYMMKGLVRTTSPIIYYVLVCVPSFVLNLIPIYFFTRPKVKEQFK